MEQINSFEDFVEGNRLTVAEFIVKQFPRNQKLVPGKVMQYTKQDTYWEYRKDLPKSTFGENTYQYSLDDMKNRMVKRILHDCKGMNIVIKAVRGYLEEDKEHLFEGEPMSLFKLEVVIFVWRS